MPATTLIEGRVVRAASGLYVDGAWREPSGAGRLTVADPASGAEVGSVVAAGPGEVTGAVTAAHRAFAGWAALSPDERGAPLRRAHALVLERADELARALTLQGGKPLDEARGEVLWGAEFLLWYAEEIRRPWGEILASNRPNQRLYVRRRPRGVVACITPWNFPSSMVPRKLAPALAAGNTVVLKPAEQTPLCRTSGAPVRAAPTTSGSPQTRFTTPGGNPASWKHPKSSTADLHAVADPDRRRPPGEPLTDVVRHGALDEHAVGRHARAVARVREHVRDAVARDARVLTGGAAPDGLDPERFFAPTVLVDVPLDALVAVEETFGPVAPVIAFDTEAEAIALANATEYGLAAYLFTRDLGRAHRVGEALDYGMVAINDGALGWVQAPFGGIKGSGDGREGGRLGLEEYLDVQSLSVNF